MSHDSGKRMALGLASIPENGVILEPDMSVRRLLVPPGGVPYVISDISDIRDYPNGTATLTARR